jgi:5'-nucleotidase
VTERGPVSYEISYKPEDLEPDSDLYALLVEKKVSVTPISFDLTSRVDFAALDSLLRQ